jgi:hypothetical protein
VNRPKIQIELLVPSLAISLVFSQLAPMVDESRRFSAFSIADDRCVREVVTFHTSDHGVILASYSNND